MYPHKGLSKTCLSASCCKPEKNRKYWLHNYAVRFLGHFFPKIKMSNAFDIKSKKNGHAIMSVFCDGYGAVDIFWGL